jgi:REP element-mobilizing transposase RayT
MNAWNGWYHVNGHTYGTWLRGDPRGWRTRWGREHVEGDYRHPPTEGTFERLHAQSQRLMNRPPVRLDGQQRRIALQALVEKLHGIAVEVIAASVDASHYHLLARFPDGQVRGRVGLAKKHASHVLRKSGLEGGAWGKKNRPLPIRDRAHQVNVYNYIIAHGKKGACVWTFKEGLYWLDGDDKAHG